MSKYVKKVKTIAFKVGATYLATKGLKEVPVVCLGIHTPTHATKYGLFDTGTEVLKLKVFLDDDDEKVKLETATYTTTLSNADGEVLVWAVYADLLA